MRPLRFVALSEDGTHLVLAPDVPEAIDNGERFLLALDDRLRAAARGDLSRLGQIEIEIEAQLRPREIQARIRAGETPDSVAAAAGVRIERVMTYAHPVLQERAQVALRAQQARVKIEDAGSQLPTLTELIESRLLVRGLDETHIDWDARRLENGQWEITSTWDADDRTITAHWRYDMQNSIVYPGSKDTIEMVEPKPRLAAVPVPTDDPSLGSDSPDVEAPQPIPLQRPRAEQAPRGRERHRPAPVDSDLEQLFLAAELEDAIDPGHLGNASRRPELTEDDLDEPTPFDQDEMVDGGEASAEPGQDEEQDAPQQAVSSAKGDKKPRIPSWDDIVFGVKKRK